MPSIPCPHPDKCGAQFHQPGSAAALTCSARRQVRPGSEFGKLLDAGLLPPKPTALGVVSSHRQPRLQRQADVPANSLSRTVEVEVPLELSPDELTGFAVALQHTGAHYHINGADTDTPTLTIWGGQPEVWEATLTYVGDHRQLAEELFADAYNHEFPDDDVYPEDDIVPGSEYVVSQDADDRSGLVQHLYSVMGDVGRGARSNRRIRLDVRDGSKYEGGIEGVLYEVTMPGYDGQYAYLHSVTGAGKYGDSDGANIELSNILRIVELK